MRGDFPSRWVKRGVGSLRRKHQAGKRVIFRDEIACELVNSLAQSLKGVRKDVGVTRSRRRAQFLAPFKSP